MSKWDKAAESSAKRAAKVDAEQLDLNAQIDAIRPDIDILTDENNTAAREIRSFIKGYGRLLGKKHPEVEIDEYDPNVKKPTAWQLSVTADGKWDLAYHGEDEGTTYCIPYTDSVQAASSQLIVDVALERGHAFGILRLPESLADQLERTQRASREISRMLYNDLVERGIDPRYSQ